MRIILIGGTGTIGTAVQKQLSKRNEIVVVGHSKGQFTCDIESEESIKSLFKKVGKFDALIITTGRVTFDNFANMNSESYQLGLKSKLMGQVNCVLIGREYINDKGSFTLTSGILSDDPIQKGTSASMVNGAINSFVIGAAIEMQRGIRINAVSPTVLTESMDVYGPYFLGYSPVPGDTVALAYEKSVEGHQTGQIFKVW